MGTYGYLFLHFLCAYSEPCFVELKRILSWNYVNLLCNHKRLDAPVTVASSRDKEPRVLTRTTNR